MMTFPTEWKVIKFMFQTTQIILNMFGRMEVEGIKLGKSNTVGRNFSPIFQEETNGKNPYGNLDGIQLWPRIKF
jgi:hypothetical protein